MVDTRTIILLNIFSLFITPRLSTFNSGGNSSLILVGTCMDYRICHFELEIRSTQYQNYPLKKNLKFEPILVQILENFTNFHFGSNFAQNLVYLNMMFLYY